MMLLNIIFIFILYTFVIQIPCNLYYINPVYHNLLMIFISLVLFLWGSLFVYQLYLYEDVNNFNDIIITDRRFQISYFYIFQKFIVFSKILEWGDSLLLKQSKKQIGTLHFIHHGTIVTAFYYGCFIPGFIVTGLLNSFVHILMYTYYLIKCKYFSKLITSIQIIQLIFNTIFNFYGCIFNTPLHNHYNVKKYSLYCSICTFTYLLLFINFYISRYRIKKK